MVLKKGQEGSTVIANKKSCQVNDNDVGLDNNFNIRLGGRFCRVESITNPALSTVHLFRFYPRKACAKCCEKYFFGY